MRREETEKRVFESIETAKTWSEMKYKIGTVLEPTFTFINYLEEQGLLPFDQTDLIMMSEEEVAQKIDPLYEPHKEFYLAELKRRGYKTSVE